MAARAVLMQKSRGGGCVSVTLLTATPSQLQKQLSNRLSFGNQLQHDYASIMQSIVSYLCPICLSNAFGMGKNDSWEAGKERTQRASTDDH